MLRISSDRKYLAVLMFLLATVLIGAIAQAQVATVGLKAHISFKFTVENTTLPAGDYTIAPSSSAAEPNILRMRDLAKDISIMLSAEYVNNLSGTKGPELVFDKIGGIDFLREIRTDTKAYVLGKYSEQVKLEKGGQKAQSHKVSGTSVK